MLIQVEVVEIVDRIVVVDDRDARWDGDEHPMARCYLGKSGRLRLMACYLLSASTSDRLATGDGALSVVNAVQLIFIVFSPIHIRHV